MITKERRFQVSGARCQTGNQGWVAEAVGASRMEKCKNEGSSGDVDENKGEQVSGVRCQVPGRASGMGCRATGGMAVGKGAKMKVHPEMLMITKESRFQVRGARILAIPENLSGTGRPVVVTDEIWYSEELHINLVTKHNDPRTGELTITVTGINPSEPDVSLFAIPPDYKLVDMTPPGEESP